MGAARRKAQGNQARASGSRDAQSSPERPFGPLLDVLEILWCGMGEETLSMVRLQYCGHFPQDTKRQATARFRAFFERLIHDGLIEVGRAPWDTKRISADRKAWRALSADESLALAKTDAPWAHEETGVDANWVRPTKKAGQVFEKEWEAWVEG